MTTSPAILPYPVKPTDHIVLAGKTYEVRAKLVDTQGRPVLLPTGTRISVALCPSCGSEAGSGCQASR